MNKFFVNDCFKYFIFILIFYLIGCSSSKETRYEQKPNPPKAEEKKEIEIEQLNLTLEQEKLSNIQLVHFKTKNENSYSIFISPKCFIDTCRHSSYIKYQFNLDVKILDIDLFLNQLEEHKTLKNIAFSRTSCN